MSNLTKLMLEHQGDTAQLRALLVQFRASKQKQLQSVEIAALLATISAITFFAFLGTSLPCSWPCPTLWCSSLFLGISALNHTPQLRLLDPLPRTSKEADGLGDKEIRRLLLMVAAKEDRRRSCRGSTKDEVRLEKGGDQSATLKRNLALSWVWQSPKILAWSSWIFFLLGFICDALVFFIIPQGVENKNTHQAVIIEIPIVLASLALVNFLFCSAIAKSTLLRVETKQGGNEDVASSGSEGGDVWDLRLL
ncbi:hypothetical protein PGQ11_015530 [Apiospora arundinis]|uniref:Uncharacterized protein n=1 Tax=Apiospora arundinis TaxID=335852 RepID=A0ABR2HLS0_9PEZI